MRWVPRAAIMFITFAISKGACAGDFSDAFDRVQQVWDNVTSFQTKAWTAINDSLSSGSGDPANNFYNNTAPQEITDASKIALTQIFPGVANAVDVADNVDKYASQWASQAQNNAQANVDALSQKFTNLENQIGDYFGGGGSEAPHGGNACAIFTGGICPPCPVFGVPDATGNCPNAPPAQTQSSITDSDLAAIGASNTGAAAAPTSLAADAQQLPGQLSAFDQQQAALELARQQQLALQQQQLALQRQQEQAQAAAIQAQNTQATYADSAQTNNSDAAPSEAPSSGSSWGSVLMQGLGAFAGMRQRTQPPPVSGGLDCHQMPVSCLSPAYLATTCGIAYCKAPYGLIPHYGPATTSSGGTVK